MTRRSGSSQTGELVQVRRRSLAQKCSTAWKFARHLPLPRFALFQLYTLLLFEIVGYQLTRCCKG